MITLKKKNPSYFHKGIPVLKQIINTSEQAIRNSMLDPDEREKNSDMGESSSDDDVHDLGFSEKPRTKHLKGFVEAEQDDDVTKNMSREDRKASKLQDKTAGKEFWNQSTMMKKEEEGAAGAGGKLGREPVAGMMIKSL